jgi:hypothetical protein
MKLSGANRFKKRCTGQLAEPTRSLNRRAGRDSEVCRERILQKGLRSPEKWMLLETPNVVSLAPGLPLSLWPFFGSTLGGPGPSGQLFTDVTQASIGEVKLEASE